MQPKIYGAVEFGGTTTLCGRGYASGELIDQTTILTTTVTETLNNVYRYFRAQGPIAALGVGAFGPLNLEAASPRYGAIVNSPKPGWENVALKSLLEDHFKVAVAIDLDVNAAALGELSCGVAQDIDSFVYLTVGTGIGGSLVIDGQLVHGLLNLEMGHVRIPHEPFIDGFAGSCPFHKDCLEGIASGTAMEQRYHQKAEHITDEGAWNLEASYIAQGLSNIMMTLGPSAIILGGGLLNHPGLIDAIRQAVVQNINGYLTFPDVDGYIRRSSGETNGLRGAIKLAALRGA
ncbi:MAG: ROK family protein [Candidatus Saccharibacteria bacterium]